MVNYRTFCADGSVSFMLASGRKKLMLCAAEDIQKGEIIYIKGSRMLLEVTESERNAVCFVTDNMKFQYHPITEVKKGRLDWEAPSLKDLLNSHHTLSLLTVKPYCLFDCDSQQPVRSIVFSLMLENEYRNLVFYYDTNKILRRVGNDGTLGLGSTALLNLFREKEINAANEKMIALIEEARYTRPAQALSVILCGCEGKTEDEVWQHIEKTVERRIKDIKRERAMKKFIEKYPSLFPLDGPGLLRTTSLDFNVNGNDFYVSIPMRRYPFSDADTKKYTVRDNAAFLRENKEDFFRYAWGSVRACSKLIEKIGDASFYRISDCTITQGGEVELIFSPKEELEAIFAQENIAKFV